MVHFCLRAAILGDRNTVVTFDHAGHAGCPQYFVIQFAVDVAVGVIQKLQCVVKAIKRRGYKLHQGFRVIGCNTRMRECRTQRRWMRRLRNTAADGNPQAFFFEANPAALQHFANVAGQ